MTTAPRTDEITFATESVSRPLIRSVRFTQVMRAIEDKSYTEIANEVQLSESTVKTTYYRLLKKLKAVVTEDSQRIPKTIRMVRARGIWYSTSACKGK